MAYTLTDLLRRWTASAELTRPAFVSDDEAYDFCRKAYEETGVTADLQEAYQFYKNNFDDKGPEQAGSRHAPNK